jgi:hypothetical protein
MLSLRFFEIFILKNIRRGTHQAEANFDLAGIAGWERVPGEHYNLMSAPVLLIVDYFINAGFTHSFPGAEGRAGAMLTPGMQPWLIASLSAGQAAIQLVFPVRERLLW